ncbi:MAG: hypothetical protein BGO11_14045 [Solirubrobacterales bacterium 70-9]|nr:MAG: hypothetical protein BGO11_14045 [Solirubrobacterales bacterium 70-9]
MSTLALFVALGGVSYGAIKISGRQIKAHTITARNVRPNSLGGRQIKERSLGIVPGAREAALLDGHTAESLQVQCPAGTVPVDDTCIETQAHAPASFHSALLQCGGTEDLTPPGRRLPTYQELTMALTHQEITLAPGGELTSEVEASSAGQPLNVIYVTEALGGWGLTPDNAAGAKSYRCVADPLN